MPNPFRPYKNQERKDINSQNLFVRPKSMVRSADILDDRRSRYKRWITFFRRNPHRFIELYFGIKLYPYQILMIYALQKSNFAYIVASRATAKTWIIAVWTLTLAVLYPGIKIIACSKTIKQGGLIVSEKISALSNTYPNVAREIDHISISSNLCEAIFHNGSTIRVVPSADTARGFRANYIIIEEARLVPKQILEQVIKPMLEVRTPPFRLESKYKNIPELKEEGRMAYITSAWYTSEYWYTYVKSCIKRMIMGDETASFLAFDYLITLYHNIKTEDMIKNEMTDMDEVSVQMEYLNIPSGSSGKSYFKPSLFPRNLKRAFYPQKDDNYDIKKNPYDLKKVDGEIRFVSVDIATRANKANDNSIILCVRAIPILNKGYERHLVYMESYKGRDVGVQARRIKDIFFDFDADYLVMDLQNAGIGVFDSLTEPTLCEDRGITYDPLGVAGDEFEFVKQDLREELRRDHTRSLNPREVIFPIMANQDLNSQIANAFRISLQKKLWNFLIGEGEAEEFLIKNTKEFTKDINDTNISSFFLNPYINTGLMIGECINLDMSLVGGKIKLSEKSGCYKDRYSAVSYCNWIISYFDQELLKENSENKLSDWDYISSMTYTW